MNNIPTAEEFLQCCDLPEETATIGGMVKSSLILIEFAQLHVEAALKAASENVELDSDYNPRRDEVEYFVKKSSILNAYPKTLIQ